MKIKIKRLIGVLLILAMAVTALPPELDSGLNLGFTLKRVASAETADAPDDTNDNISGVSEDVFQGLGLNTGTNDIQKTLDSGALPTTDEPFALLTIPELMQSRDHISQFFDLDKTYNTSPFTTTQNVIQGTETTTNADITRSTAFDPDGDARKEYVAYVMAKNTHDSKHGDSCDLYLYIVNGDVEDKGGKYKTYKNIGGYPFKIYPTHAGAFLSITAGDYDGDGKDEIAVVTAGTPNSYAYNGQRVEIYKYDEVKNELTLKTSKWVDSGNGDDGNLSFLTRGQQTEKVEQYEYLSVNLANIPAADAVKGGVDALAIASSYLRGAENTKNKSTQNARSSKSKNACLTFWYDILDEKNNKFVQNELRDSWESLYNYKKDDGKKRYEAMLFPSVTAGDINGDDIPEVIVAGYRLNEENAEKLDNRALDRDRYLITYYSWDTKNSAFKKACPMQWVSFNKNDNTGLGDGFLNHYSDRYYAATPLPMTVFSERGPDNVNSIFCAGTILSLPGGLPGIDGDGDGGGGDGSNLEDVNPEDLMKKAGGLYNGYEYKPDKNMQTAGLCFAIRSSMNIKDCRQYNAAITEAVSGNFNADMTGREQVVFAYVTEHQTVVKYNTELFRAVPYDDGGDKIRLDRQTQRTRDDSGWLTIAAPDIDRDSIICRYNNNRKPDYYFSDPNITAVLQAPPYFAELGNDGWTAYGKSQGSSRDWEHELETKAHAMLGIEAEVDLEFFAGTRLAKIRSTVTFSAESHYNYQMETTATRAVTYEITNEDAVIMNMAPYIRYYYEQWDPDSQDWIGTVMDMPLTPRDSMISVDDYDEVARANGWRTLRDNALGNSEPGRPETYHENVPDPGSWNIMEPEHGVIDWKQAVQMEGAQTVTLSHEHSYGWGMGLGASIGLDVEGGFVVGIAGVGAEVSYTGGFVASHVTGNDYEGRVSGIPGDKKNYYDFQWDFGMHFVNIFDKDNPYKKYMKNMKFMASQEDADDYMVKHNLDTMVLGYRVKDVKRPPYSPENLFVQGTDKDSVTLSWSPVEDSRYKIHHYAVSQHTGGTHYTFPDIPASAIKNGFYSFTDKGSKNKPLLPETVYEYVVQAYSIVNGTEERESGYSDVVYAFTSGDGEDSTVINKHPESATVKAGNKVTFSVDIANGDGTENYQWMVRKNLFWEKVGSGKKDKQFSVTAGRSMDGWEYRCEVTARDGGNVYVLYSQIAKLNVEATVTDTAVSLSKNKAAAKETRQKTDQNGMIRYTEYDGDQVTATATVKDKDGKPVTSGIVVFELVNMTTGLPMGKGNAALDGNGKATYSFKPTAAGTVKVTAQYLGNEQCYPSNKAGANMNAVWFFHDWFVSGADKTELEYGDSVTFAPVAYKANQSLNPSKSNANPKITVVRDDVVTKADNLIKGKVFTPDKPGVYYVTFTSGDTSTRATITVYKKTLTVTASDQTLPPNSPVSAFNQTAFEYDGLIGGDSAAGMYKAVLLDADTSLKNFGGGEYIIKPELNVTLDSKRKDVAPDGYYELAEKYNIMLETGTLTIDPDTHNVNFSAGEHGKVSASAIDGTALTPSEPTANAAADDNTVTEGTTVTFTVTPDKGYTVDQWSVTVDGESLEDIDINALSVEVIAGGDINANVTFKKDAEAPQIERSFPKDGGTAPLKGFVIIDFNEPMNTSGNSGGVVIIKPTATADGGNPDDNAAPVPLENRRWSADGKSLFVMYDGLELDWAYEVSVSGFKDIAGFKMEEDYNVSFTTKKIDLDGDGKIGLYDVLEILKRAVGKGGILEGRGDFDGDGEVTAEDAKELLKRIQSNYDFGLTINFGNSDTQDGDGNNTDAPDQPDQPDQADDQADE